MPESIRLRSGVEVLPVVVEREGETLYLCSRSGCPHYAEQLALPGAPAAERDSTCRLAGYFSDLCAPLYCELAEALDRSYRETLTLEEAERFERLYQGAAEEIRRGDPLDMSKEVLDDASAPARCDESRAATLDTSPEASPDMSPLEAGRVAPAGATRACEWCGRPIPPGKRRDSLTCSKPCRQAKSRFRITGVQVTAASRPMRFAYADPPYPGLSWKYYRGEEVDHEALIKRLVAGYPDGWALSTSARALQSVLALCPEGVRVAPWVNGPRKVKSVRPLVAWEPVIFYGGRPRREAIVDDLCDVLIYRGRQHSHPGALVGMKPATFCEWMFKMLGAEPGDSLDDLFPGSGAVRRAWDLYVSRSG